ncbi:unnamed protein product [Heligmosomoides polygyrus]|uniref:Centromere protein L n=1 Tax=Heligmosomoides polygyrus TaxID=6339 RepID=A0A3P8EHY6_HELPZ|nr:unnamed protein product [Heligmosomoides polygyrus]
MSGFKESLAELHAVALRSVTVGSLTMHICSISTAFRKEPAISIVGRTWKSADVDKEVAAMQNANALSIRTCYARLCRNAPIIQTNFFDFRNGMDQQLSVDANSSHDTSPKKSVQLTLSSKHKKVLRLVKDVLQLEVAQLFLAAVVEECLKGHDA